jgi:hypothetical protein
MMWMPFGGEAHTVTFVESWIEQKNYKDFPRFFSSKKSRPHKTHILMVEAQNLGPRLCIGTC